MNINYTNTGAGKNDVRSFGEGLDLLTGTIDFDSSYSSGGEDLDLSSHFDKTVIDVIIFPTDGYVFEYDRDNQKVLVYEEDGSAGPLAEAADTTDLSSVTGVRFLAVGM